MHHDKWLHESIVLNFKQFYVNVKDVLIGTDLEFVTVVNYGDLIDTYATFPLHFSACTCLVYLRRSRLACDCWSDHFCRGKRIVGQQGNELIVRLFANLCCFILDRIMFM